MWIDGMPLDGQGGRPIIGACRPEITRAMPHGAGVQPTTATMHGTHLAVAVVPVKTEKALLGRTEGQREIKAPPVTVLLLLRAMTGHMKHPRSQLKLPSKLLFACSSFSFLPPPACNFLQYLLLQLRTYLISLSVSFQFSCSEMVSGSFV
jgi:hypothetical protein